MLFQALSGFNAQRISLHRLDVRNSSNEQQLKSLFIKEENSYCTAEFLNHVINQKYPAYTFQSGQSYSIVGDSGTGKTLYLRCLAGMQPCQEFTNSIVPRENVSYFDRHSLFIFKKIGIDNAKNSESESIFIHFIEEQLRQMKRIFILDEALVHFSVEDAKTLSQALARRIESSNGLLLLVDHRFHMKNIVPLNQISSNRVT